MRKVIYICLGALFFSSFLSSCVRTGRLNYVQDSKFNTERMTQVATQEQSLYKLQPYDIISIQIRDAAGKTSDQFALQQGGGGGFIVPNEFTIFLGNYPIDAAGNVNFPTIGSIAVKDKSTLEVQDYIAKIASEYYKDPIVIVRLISFRITVLGQVRSPGRYLLGNERMNILEAISLAGDLTENADRKVQLVRLNGNYEEVILLDLTKSSLFNSPYYYLRPNDKIIVRTMKARVGRENLNLLSTLFSAVSTLLLILNYFNNNR